MISWLVLLAAIALIYQLPARALLAVNILVLLLMVRIAMFPQRKGNL
jgi:hypothetical protein